MARRPRSSQTENRTSRLKLQVRKKPYWKTVGRGLALGYRRCATGSGTWVVRATDGHGGEWTKAFATADDFQDSNGNAICTYWEAIDKARALAHPDDNGKGDRPATVGEAVDAYAADL